MLWARLKIKASFKKPKICLPISPRVSNYLFAYIIMEKPNIIMFGAPGSGKGTRSATLSEILEIPQIATGDIFRSNIKNQTPLGVKVKSFMDHGELVPDEIVVEMVSDRLSNKDCDNGFILDGFPRTLAQAEALDKILKDAGKPISAVINLVISDEEIVRRVSGRLVCPTCQATYHKTMNPPKKGGLCDKCATPLASRPDDAPETVLRRLEVFKSSTLPILKHYEGMGLVVMVPSEISQAGLKADMTDLAKRLGFTVKK